MSSCSVRWVDHNGHAFLAVTRSTTVEVSGAEADDERQRRSYSLVARREGESGVQ